MVDLRKLALAALPAAALAVACGGSSDGDTPPSDPPASVSPAAKQPSSEAYLLPNLRSLPAADVQILPASDGARELRFSATLSNTGDGPLVVAPDNEAVCPAGQRHAAQRLVVDADRDRRYDPAVDTVTKRAPGGCMADHPTHEHWHFNASASYRLTAPGQDTAIAASNKVSFCLRDSHSLDGQQRESTYGDCDRESVQGISIGFGDHYGFELDGQALPLPADLGDGVYCLTLSADPDDLLHETDDGDNAATIGVQLTGTTATATAPPATC